LHQDGRPFPRRPWKCFLFVSCIQGKRLGQHFTSNSGPVQHHLIACESPASLSQKIPRALAVVATEFHQRTEKGVRIIAG